MTISRATTRATTTGSKAVASRTGALSGLLLTVLLLSGCEKSMADIEQSKLDMKARAGSSNLNLELPQVPEPRSLDYQANALRRPFARPQPTYVAEAANDQNANAEEQANRPLNCLKPDGQRTRQPLERYPLDSLVMRGVIGKQDLWALIDSGDGNIYRVGPGQYLGLDHGRIVDIDKRSIELIELVPDGTGCWQERLTTLALMTE